jgi:hypothetical protein
MFVLSWYIYILFYLILYSKSHFDSNKSKKGLIEKNAPHIVQACNYFILNVFFSFFCKTYFFFKWICLCQIYMSLVLLYFVSIIYSIFFTHPRFFHFFQIFSCFSDKKKHRLIGSMSKIRLGSIFRRQIAARV